MSTSLSPHDTVHIPFRYTPKLSRGDDSVHLPVTYIPFGTRHCPHPVQTHPFHDTTRQLSFSVSRHGAVYTTSASGAGGWKWVKTAKLMRWLPEMFLSFGCMVLSITTWVGESMKTFQVRIYEYVYECVEVVPTQNSTVIFRMSSRSVLMLRSTRSVSWGVLGRSTGLRPWWKTSTRRMMSARPQPREIG